MCLGAGSRVVVRDQRSGNEGGFQMPAFLGGARGIGGGRGTLLAGAFFGDGSRSSWSASGRLRFVVSQVPKCEGPGAPIGSG